MAKATMKTKTKTRVPAEALADISLKDDCLLGTAQAAALVALTPKTLRQLRCDKAGPRCLKLGTAKQSRTVYRRSDLEAWVRSRVVAVQGS
jgi:predicted DNA-binding transcriptional regulator AlpA